MGGRISSGNSQKWKILLFIFCTELQGELKRALFGKFTNNPAVRGKPRHADTKADLIFKCVFCNYL